MISHSVESVLHRCFILARQANHRFVTVDHLVLELLGEESVAERLQNCSVDVEALRSEIESALSNADQFSEPLEKLETEPSLEFQQVIQRAILNTQQSGDNEVHPVALLLAIIEQRRKKGGPLWDAVSKNIADLLKVVGQHCALCRTYLPLPSLTVIPGRGVLCDQCIAAVLATRGTNAA